MFKMYNDVQKKILNSYMKSMFGKSRKGFTWQWASMGEYIGYTENGSYMYVIHKNFVIFNNDKLFQGRPAIDMTVLFRDNADETNLIWKRTGATYKLKSGIVAREFSHDNERMYINDSYLKYFEDELLIFCSKDKYDPVNVFTDYGLLVGIIMPMRVKEEDVKHV